MSKELPAHIKTLADELEAAVTLDVATKTGDIPGFEDIVAKHLPPALTMELLKESQGFLIDVTAAQTQAFGNRSQQAMVADKELDRTTLRTKLGHSAIDTSYSRHKSGTAAGAEWNKYGVAKSDLIIGVGRRTGHYKQVVAYLGEEAEKVFAS
jgi:hypothetical protein